MIQLIALVLLGQGLLLLIDEKSLLPYIRIALFLFLYTLIVRVVL